MKRKVKAAVGSWLEVRKSWPMSQRRAKPNSGSIVQAGQRDWLSLETPASPLITLRNNRQELIYNCISMAVLNT